MKVKQIIPCLLLFLCLTASCRVDCTELDTETYVSVQFGILQGLSSDRPVAKDHRAPGTDVDNKLDELRVIIFPAGENRSVVNYLATAQDLTNRRATFLFDKMARYDFYFIANESASNQKSGVLAFLSGEQVNRADLESMTGVQMVNVASEVQNSGLGSAIMMTALYKNVPVSTSLRGSGTQSDPYVVDFTAFNKIQRPKYTAPDRSKAELMRSLAKVELTLKGIVAIRTKPGSTATTPQYDYSWTLPYGYKDNSKLQIEILNMPKSYTLFPSSKLTDIATVGTLPPYQFSFKSKPDPKYVILPDISEPSIGGIYMGDYVITIYLPEYLAAKSLAENAQPAIKITYYEAGLDTPKSRIYPFKNESASAQTTDYETILKDLPERADWNVYRNRLYQINANILGKEL